LNCAAEGLLRLDEVEVLKSVSEALVRKCALSVGIVAPKNRIDCNYLRLVSTRRADPVAELNKELALDASALGSEVM
jgi:hypothetical protein